MADRKIVYVSKCCNSPAKKPPCSMEKGQRVKLYLGAKPEGESSLGGWRCTNCRKPCKAAGYPPLKRRRITVKRLRKEYSEGLLMPVADLGFYLGENGQLFGFNGKTYNEGDDVADEAGDGQQEAAKGATQQATREQDAALTALDAWRAQYIKLARVALRGKSQLLEKIGVAVRSAKVVRKKKAAG